MYLITRMTNSDLLFFFVFFFLATGPTASFCCPKTVVVRPRMWKNSLHEYEVV